MGVINPVTLKSEIVNDPAGRGYLLVRQNVEALIVLLNEKIASVQLPVEFVDAWQVLAACDKSEFNALTTGPAQRLGIILAAGKVSAQSANINGMLFGAPPAIFPVSSQTKSNLQALTTRNASRMELLFGENTQAGREDVSFALRG